MEMSSVSGWWLCQDREVGTHKGAGWVRGRKLSEAPERVDLETEVQAAG